MLAHLDLHKILFLDIETVPLYPNFEDAPALEQQYFAEKTAYQRKDDFNAEEFYSRAGIWAEFGKIVCISVGNFSPQQDPRGFRLKTFKGEEPDLLKNLKH
jgi:hypothetical protein